MSYSSNNLISEGIEATIEGRLTRLKIRSPTGSRWDRLIDFFGFAVVWCIAHEMTFKINLRHLVFISTHLGVAIDVHIVPLIFIPVLIPKSTLEGQILRIGNIKSIFQWKCRHSLCGWWNTISPSYLCLSIAGTLFFHSIRMLKFLH